MQGRVIRYRDTNAWNEFTTATCRAGEFTNRKFENGEDRICRHGRGKVTGGLTL
jgi:hypothetical protein